MWLSTPLSGTASCSVASLNSYVVVSVISTASSVRSPSCVCKRSTLLGFVCSEHPPAARQLPGHGSAEKGELLCHAGIRSQLVTGRLGVGGLRLCVVFGGGGRHYLLRDIRSTNAAANKVQTEKRLTCTDFKQSCCSSCMRG